MTKTVNTELLDLVVKTIKADPAHWNQAVFRTAHTDPVTVVEGEAELTCGCNTAYCFAGWTVQLGSVNRPRWANSATLYADEHDSAESQANGYITAQDRAIHLLGIDTYDAMVLFAGTNSLPRIEAIVDALKKRATR